jgi:hypothetical protein
VEETPFESRAKLISDSTLWIIRAGRTERNLFLCSALQTFLSTYNHALFISKQMYLLDIIVQCAPEWPAYASAFMDGTDCTAAMQHFF